MSRPYQNQYRAYGPPRGVPHLQFMPFSGHRTMEWVIADEKRQDKTKAVVIDINGPDDGDVA